MRLHSAMIMVAVIAGCTSLPTESEPCNPTTPHADTTTPSGTIVVRIVNPQGEPQSGVNVTAWRDVYTGATCPSATTATTDANGEVRFERLRTGPFGVTIPGSQGQGERVQVEAGKTVDVTLTQSPTGARPQFSIYLNAPDGYTTAVGNELRLISSNDLGKAVTWRIIEQDRDRAAIQVTTDSSGLSTATLRALKPGGVQVVAEVEGEQAEALVAFLDPNTFSSPVPVPSAMPRQGAESRQGIHLITDAEGWETFGKSLYATLPSVLHSVPPPVDLQEKSLVAVVAHAFPNNGAPVVTHVETDGPQIVTVIIPYVNGFWVPEPAGFAPSMVTLLEIPKVAADAQVALRSELAIDR